MSEEKSFERLSALIKSASNLNVFTGAGVSTLSGIPDFRGPDGVYNKDYKGLAVETILSLDYFYSHPDVFYSWCKDVWYNLDRYEPNIVHTVLAKLEMKGYVKRIYTQNIDMLHQKAGSRGVYEVHGSPAINHCTKCGADYPYSEIAPIVRSGVVPKCKKCGGLIKPDIILYGEPLISDVLVSAEMDFSSSDLTLVLGSSLTVQPAASLPYLTIRNGGKIVIVNGSQTYLDNYAELKFDNLQSVFSFLDSIF